MGRGKDEENNIKGGGGGEGWRVGVGECLEFKCTQSPT